MHNQLWARALRLLARFFLHPVTLLLLALLSGIAGFALATAVPDFQQRVARVEPLQPSSAASLGDSALGRDILLEGRISSAMPAVRGNLVAFVHETYRDDSLLDGSSSEHWVEDARVTPPLTITLPDGDVRVSNTDYLFDTTATTVREAEPTLTKGAVQSRGYRAGDPVLIVGTVADDAGQRAVAASFVFAGTRADYLDTYRRLSRTTLPIAVPCLIVCVISTLALVWQIRRFIREANAPATIEA